MRDGVAVGARRPGLGANAPRPELGANAPRRLGSGANAPQPRLELRAEHGDDAVEAFWTHYRRRREPLRSAVAQLAELALSSAPDRARHGTRLLFREIVEPLCDAFTAEAAEAYRRTFAQVVSAARETGECRGIDVALSARGVRAESDLLRRRAAYLGPVPPADRARVRRVTVLSRLTLGADVAICLPVLAHAARLFPSAELRFVGGEGARVVAGAVPGVEHVLAAYGRHDDLRDRLNAWLGVCAAVMDGGPSHPGASIVVDPDSRLTQLGLLPPVAWRDYFHFPSRTYGAAEAAPLAELAARWVDETFGGERSGVGPADGAHRRRAPALVLARADADWAARLGAALRGSARRRVASVSFGVGGNDRKRVGADFEAELLEWMVGRGWRVLLARGAGRDEVERTSALGARLADRGLDVLHLGTGRTLEGLRDRDPDVVTWEADVGAFLAAIACADVYVGYDSAGQHLAAALGVPTLSVFVAAAGERHATRWTPRGRGPIRVVRAPWPPDARAVLESARAALSALAPPGAFLVEARARAGAPAVR
ncbi:MAG TPA: glycosyltransferase family 9 protein [Gammaproteobacteria bacterium]|nr:glycosyltransferase family 9 protein [Gammaproteobacteria bacterium]